MFCPIIPLKLPLQGTHEVCCTFYLICEYNLIQLISLTILIFFFFLGFQNLSLLWVFFCLTGCSVSLLMTFHVLNLWNLEWLSTQFSDCLFSFTPLVISFRLMVLKYHLHAKDFQIYISRWDLYLELNSCIELFYLTFPLEYLISILNFTGTKLNL